MNKKIGVLLINLGTPAKANRKQVKKYLKEFFSDSRVIDVNFFIRYLIFQRIIAPLRAKKVVKTYQKIWTSEGSPLLQLTNTLKNHLQQALNKNYKVEFAMRYGEPSISNAIQKLIKDNIDLLIILPLYPHYASASTGSAIDSVLTNLKKVKFFPVITTINHFFDFPPYNESLIQHIHNNLTGKNIEKLILSYHGLPTKHVTVSHASEITKCDLINNCPPLSQFNKFCYRAQCFDTSYRIAKKLDLSEHMFETVFQSRVGLNSWIQPSLEKSLVNLARNGIENIAIYSPSFVVDCLETLEEINIRARKLWYTLGGKSFHFIPSLNCNSTWINSLVQLIYQKS